MSVVGLAAYSGLRGAIAEYGTLDEKARSAIMVVTSAVNDCAYSDAMTAMLAKRAGWSDEEIGALRDGDSVGDSKLDALAGVVREAAGKRGHVADGTWSDALAAGWSEEQLGEAFASVGLTLYAPTS